MVLTAAVSGSQRDRVVAYSLAAIQQWILAFCRAHHVYVQGRSDQAAARRFLFNWSDPTWVGQIVAYDIQRRLVDALLVRHGPCGTPVPPLIATRWYRSAVCASFGAVRPGPSLFSARRLSAICVSGERPIPDAHVKTDGVCTLVTQIMVCYWSIIYVPGQGDVNQWVIASMAFSCLCAPHTLPRTLGILTILRM